MIIVEEALAIILEKDRVQEKEQVTSNRALRTTVEERETSKTRTTKKNNSAAMVTHLGRAVESEETKGAISLLKVTSEEDLKVVRKTSLNTKEENMRTAEETIEVIAIKEVKGANQITDEIETIIIIKDLNK